MQSLKLAKKTAKHASDSLKQIKATYDAAVKLDKQAREDVKDAVLFSLRL